MIGRVKEHWLELCEQAATEQDPQKLMELVAEIDRLLEAKQSRLRNASGTTSSPESPQPKG
jgi:hypothetical protein